MLKAFPNALVYKKRCEYNLQPSKSNLIKLHGMQSNSRDIVSVTQQKREFLLAVHFV